MNSAERLPVIQDTSKHDGTLYLEDPEGSPGAWIVCGNPAVVIR